MKVLLTAYGDGAVWPYTLELCRALEREGVHFCLAVLGGPLQDLQRAQLRTIRNVELYESTNAPEWSGSHATELERAGDWLLDVCDRCDADIVHLTEYAFGALPWRVRPLITAVREPPLRPELVPRIRYSLRAAGAVVVPSHARLRRLRDLFGTIALSWVIPFGRSAGTFAHREKESMIVTEGDYADAALNLSSLSRVAPRLPWPVFLVAQPPSAAAIGLTNTTFLGAMQPMDAAAVLGRAAIFAYPARGATLGYSVLDAALCGCALVLGDTPELREQWGGAALFVDPHDDDSLHGALQRLMNDADARFDYGLRARQRAGLYTSERMATSYLSVYIELALRPAGIPAARHT